MPTTAQDVRLTSIVLVVVLAIVVSMVTATQGGGRISGYFDGGFQPCSLRHTADSLGPGLAPATERFYDLTGA